MLGRQQGVFFSRWLRNPLRTGAVAPSGSELARLMASQVDVSHDGWVIELGGGTGVITEALLAHGVDPERLVVIERDQALFRMLRLRFPKILVLQLDAARLATQARGRDLLPVSTIVSSLPLLAMSARQQHRILRQGFNLLGQDQDFIQYTYGIGPPVSQNKLLRWGLTAEPVGRAWRNMPPATVWRLNEMRKGNATH